MKNNQTDGAASATPRWAVPAIYVRSATTGDGQLEERVEDARELARLHGLDVAAGDTVAEHGSGADNGRPGLQQVLRMAERGEISHLVCRDWSRLSRNQRDLRQTLAMLTEAGVTVVTGHGTHEPGVVHDVTTATMAARR